HDQYAVYTNLSRKVEKGKSSLAEPKKAKDDQFERRGLAWVIALARIETGAMLATFTDLPTPFAAVRPGRYELHAYLELLLDGARTHYWALFGDPFFKQITAKTVFKPDHQTNAYVRRLAVARAFVYAVAKMGTDGFSEQQRTELLKWKNQLDQFQLAMVAYTKRYLDRRTGAAVLGTTTKTKTTTHKSTKIGQHKR
ncbi:MAG: hypothetical protein IH991_18245, partial [Planctomycetes bacterium]|nr:hypothetical protein [Planctomycetota bacterium]